MRAHRNFLAVAASLGGLAVLAVQADTPSSNGANASSGTVSSAQINAVKVGVSTKKQIQALLGAPWRVVQFNDCGMAMDDQADETWEYRGTSPNGSYRLHVEFDTQGIVRLIVALPDSTGAQGAIAIAVPADALCPTM